MFRIFCIVGKLGGRIYQKPGNQQAWLDFVRAGCGKEHEKQPFAEQCWWNHVFPREGKRLQRSLQSEGSVMVDRKTNKRYAPRDYGLVCGEDSYMCRKYTGYHGFILKIYFLRNLKNILLECNILILHNRSKYQVLFIKVKYLNGIEYWDKRDLFIYILINFKFHLNKEIYIFKWLVLILTPIVEL